MRNLRLPIIFIVFLMAGLAVFYWIQTRRDPNQTEQPLEQRKETMGDVLTKSRGESTEERRDSSGHEEFVNTRKKHSLDAAKTRRKNALNAARRKQLLLAIRASKRQRELARTEAQMNNDFEETGLSGDYIKEIITEAIPEVKTCYEQALKETPDLGGKLIINFTISGEPDIAGLVDELEVTDESDKVIASNEMMSDCMADTILSLEFEPPKQGGTVEVSYPFTFRSGQD
ncbi:MAG: AgmX/PglI C-terminal domain-containing protein [Deltaproteobacteria bacterium]|nr:AgmX/PglI C-terminal domain-containing protein [Deltaproteobacteria bacterium]